MPRKDVRFNAKYIKNTANDRKDDKVQGKEIGNSTINGNHINDGSLTADKFAPGAVSTAGIADGSVTSDKLANNSVTSAILVDNSVTTSKIANASVANAKLADNSVTASKIATGAVSTSEINTAAQPTMNTIYTSNWFRSTGATGWYNQTHGGGIYMQDSTYVRVYGSKTFRTPALFCDGAVTVYGLSYLSNIASVNADFSINYYYGLARMTFQSDRNVVIYNSGGTALWASNTSVSDIRFKKDIINYQLDTISLIKKLNIIEFTYSEDIESDNMRRVGFSAQDVQKLIPQAVKSLGTDKDSQTLILNKEELVPFLTKAIQEQQEIIETQQKRIDSLEERLKVLEDLLK